MYMDKLLTLKASEYPGDMMTVVIGLVVVFSVLLLLTLIFWLFGKVAGGGNGAAAKTIQPVAKPAVVSAIPAAPIQSNNDIPDEVVAVIAAAVAAMSADGKQYAVRRIRPAATHNSRSVWAAAGVAENTRPF